MFFSKAQKKVSKNLLDTGMVHHPTILTRKQAEKIVLCYPGRVLLHWSRCTKQVEAIICTNKGELQVWANLGQLFLTSPEQYSSPEATLSNLVSNMSNFLRLSGQMNDDAPDLQVFVSRLHTLERLEKNTCTEPKL